MFVELNGVGIKINSVVGYSPVIQNRNSDKRSYQFQLFLDGGTFKVFSFDDMDTALIALNHIKSMIGEITKYVINNKSIHAENIQQNNSSQDNSSCYGDNIVRDYSRFRMTSEKKKRDYKDIFRRKNE